MIGNFERTVDIDTVMVINQRESHAEQRVSYLMDFILIVRALSRFSQRKSSISISTKGSASLLDHSEDLLWITDRPSLP